MTSFTGLQTLHGPLKTSCERYRQNIINAELTKPEHDGGAKIDSCGVSLKC